MATVDHPVLDALARRASSRDFTDAPVPPALLDHVLDAAVRAPTAFNFQPYSLVVVRDPARRAELARIAGGQRHVAAAPVCVVFCADTRRIERLCGLPGKLVPEEHPDAMITAVIDTSLAGMCATLAAQALGLGAVMIGGVRNDPEATAGLLGLPPGVFAVFGLSLGRPVPRAAAARPRLPRTLIAHQERYSDHPDRIPAQPETVLTGPGGEEATAEERAAWRAQVDQGIRALHRRRTPAWQRAAPIAAVRT
jgi:nitroreductase